VNDDLAAFKKEKKGESKDCSERSVMSDPVGLQLEIAKARIAFGATVDSSGYESRLHGFLKRLATQWLRFGAH
jgi:hypothetical protein